MVIDAKGGGIGVYEINIDIVASDVKRSRKIWEVLRRRIRGFP